MPVSFSSFSVIHADTNGSSALSVESLKSTIWLLFHTSCVRFLRISEAQTSADLCVRVWVTARARQWKLCIFNEPSLNMDRKTAGERSKTRKEDGEERQKMRSLESYFIDHLFYFLSFSQSMFLLCDENRIQTSGKKKKKSHRKIVSLCAFTGSIHQLRWLVISPC